jgi:calcineurin-like phosphoesterase family protein
MIYFTSDLHLNHANIIKFCNRPWNTVEEMNEGLINNWNEIVNDDDTVYCLGDMVWKKLRDYLEMIPKLKGHKILIRGNHDPKDNEQNNSILLKVFDEVHDQMYITVKGRRIYLNHYPFLCYGGSYLGKENAVWQLYGHVHSGPASTGKDMSRLNVLFPYQYDVGVDNNNYRPVSFEELNEIINNRCNG